jgi:hypothetical protein
VTLATSRTPPAGPVEDADAENGPATSAQTATPQTAIQRLFGCLDDLARLHVKGFPPRGMRIKRGNWARLVVLSPSACNPVGLSAGLAGLGRSRSRDRGNPSYIDSANWKARTRPRGRRGLERTGTHLRRSHGIRPCRQRSGWPTDRQRPPVAEWPATAQNSGEVRGPSGLTLPPRETAQPGRRW